MTSKGPLLTLGGAVVRGLEPGDPQLIGPYRLTGELGSGGMGRVFLGLSPGGRLVAVKVIRAELAADQEFRIRFSREVAAARRVSGLFTAMVVNADVDGAMPWLATAYVPGPSLSQAVTGTGPMWARPALALAAGLAEGLSGIHAAGVVHCDLKPSNVLLAQDGPRVIDFGISRAAEAASITTAGYVVGSPGFMSPEQAKGEEIGPASDIFSLGTVLTFAATGGGPFGTGSAPELAYRLVYGRPGLDGLPEELRPLVAHCLAKDPARRPTADELLGEVAAAQRASGWLPKADLGPFTPHTPPSGPVLLPAPADLAESPAGASGRHIRRRAWRPLAVGAAAAGLVAASGAVGFALSGAAGHPSASGYLPRAAAPRAVAAPGSGRRSATGPPARAYSDPRGTRRSPDSPPVRSAAQATDAGPSTDAGQATDIVPAVRTLTKPGRPTTAAAGTLAPSPPSTPDGSASPMPTASPDPAPSPSPSAVLTAAAPRITGAGTYRRGAWVYFAVRYADPGADAEGFGFTGFIGPHRTEGTYPFSVSNQAVIGEDSVAYPIDMECETPGRHKAEVEVWIYGKSGLASRPVEIDLSCQS
jgi:hypothetical protein